MTSDSQAEKSKMMNKDPRAEQVSPDTMALLSFDFLKQLTTLSLAAAGGAVTLLETVFSQSPARPVVFVAVAVLFLAAIMSLQAQQILVERLNAAQDASMAASKLKLPRTAAMERRTTLLAYMMFGCGVGALLIALFYR